MNLPAPQSLMLHDLASYGVPGLLNLRIQGHEPLPRTGPLLLLTNRCSLLDPWLLSMAVGRPVQMAATSPLFWLPPLRDFASRLNAVPLVPDDHLAGQGAEAFARSLESGRPVVWPMDLHLERRAEGPRFTVPPAFLDVLLATAAERIPVVPVLCHGAGFQWKLTKTPFLAPLLAAGSRVVTPDWQPVIFARNTVKLGHPVYWRDGGSPTTLQEFRRRIEDSLGALL